MKFLATDQRHFHIRVARQPFVEVHCRVKPGKSTAGNDYSSRLHPITANRNTTRVTNILLKAFHHSVFFPSFSQACGSGNFTKFRICQRFTDGPAEPVILCQSLAFSDRFFHHLPRSC